MARLRQTTAAKAAAADTHLVADCLELLGRRAVAQVIVAEGRVDGAHGLHGKQLLVVPPHGLRGEKACPNICICVYADESAHVH